MLRRRLVVSSFVVMMLGGIFKPPGTVADCFDGWGEPGGERCVRPATCPWLLRQTNFGKFPIISNGFLCYLLTEIFFVALCFLFLSNPWCTYAFLPV